ncbi:MAG: hypothetical protein EOO89_01505 [Pedobacter sp.]|nr:MAG: hypothetical protein EOO89_01505 [Pedobacter sp.]
MQAFFGLLFHFIGGFASGSFYIPYNISEEQLKKGFELKNNGQLLYGSPKLEAISETLNHWVHHRGQLTVYMRLNDIAVPSIYGPSADERTF